MSEEELYKKIKNGEIKNLRIDSRTIIEVEKMISTGNIELYTKDYVNDLQQRIDKAIEYIEKQKEITENYKFALSHIECDKVLSILRGEDNGT